MNNQPTPEEELAQLQQTGHLRTLREVTSPHPPHLTHQGRTLINFASNDYLGFSKHPALIQAATKALTDYGTGSTASRLISGSLHPHHQLEEQIAHHKKADAALTFANGYATALGTIPAIIKKGDTVLISYLEMENNTSLLIKDGGRLFIDGTSTFNHGIMSNGTITNLGKV